MAAVTADAARERERVLRKLPWGRVNAGPSVLPGMLLAIFLGLPLLGLLVRAVGAGGLLDAMQHPIVLEALRLSLLTTLLVLLAALLLGSPLALLLARRRFRGIGLLDSLIDLPIVLPPAVAGLALLVTFGRRGLLGGPLGAMGIELPFTTAAVVLASLFVAAPFYVRAARSGFLAVPREFEEAARVEGASEWQVFRYVTAPVAAPSLLGGAILCWARALGEFGATIMFAGQFPGRTQTMPLAIYAALESDTDAALGLSVMLLAISFALLLLFRRWLRTHDSVGFNGSPVSFQDRLQYWADAKLQARQAEAEQQDSAQKREQARIASNLRRARRTFTAWDVEQSFRDVESALRRIHGAAPGGRAKLSSRGGSLWISATAGIDRAWGEQEQRMNTAAMIYLYLAYDGRTDILTIKAYGAGVEANETGPLSDWTKSRLESVLLLAIGA